MARGGKREGAGRKPKADEQKLIERLSPLDDIALNALKNAIEEEESWAVKLFMEYRYGKPKQQIENTNTHTFTEGFDIKKLYAKET
jgi:hypothetical protein